MEIPEALLRGFVQIFLSHGTKRYLNIPYNCGPFLHTGGVMSGDGTGVFCHYFPFKVPGYRLTGETHFPF